MPDWQLGVSISCKSESPTTNAHHFLLVLMLCSGPAGSDASLNGVCSPVFAMRAQYQFRKFRSKRKNLSSAAKARSFQPPPSWESLPTNPSSVVSICASFLVLCGLASHLCKHSVKTLSVSCLSSLMVCGLLIFSLSSVS